LTDFCVLSKVAKFPSPLTIYEFSSRSVQPAQGAADARACSTEGKFMRDASLPITLIIVGCAWLLWYYRLFPDIDWIIAAGLIVGGMGVLYLDGITKKSIVTGPFLIASGIAWALHDRWRVTWFVLIPTLLIFLGVLMLIARGASIPERRLRGEQVPDRRDEN
jgi:hypothetical protein